MKLELDDLVVLVTGSSRGIGRAAAEAFLRERAKVVITGRDPVSLESARMALAAQHGDERVMAIAADLSSETGIESVLRSVGSSWGVPHVVVANVGTGRFSRGWDISRTDWEAAFRTNLFGGADVVRAVLPGMIARGSGVVVFVASIAGLESLGAPLPYGAAKAAVISLAEGLSREVAGSGIRVNVVAPGNVIFPGGRWEELLEKDHVAVEKYIAEHVPAARFGRPEEIADVIVFMSSARASFLLGACVVVDGGQTHG